MKQAYILIGLPGTGKSTWCYDNADGEVISSDNVIEHVAEEYGMTYNEAFSYIIDFADMIAKRHFNNAVKYQSNIVIDRTNLSKKSRRRFIEPLKKAGYTIHAVSFPIPSDWEKRLTQRPGKTIPVNILDSMRKVYEEPSLDEGFDSIEVVTTN